MGASCVNMSHEKKNYSFILLFFHRILTTVWVFSVLHHFIVYEKTYIEKRLAYLSYFMQIVLIRQCEERYSTVNNFFLYRPQKLSAIMIEHNTSRVNRIKERIFYILYILKQIKSKNFSVFLYTKKGNF